MITYDFKCDVCGCVQTLFSEPKNIDDTEHFCPKCDEKMRRLFSSPGIRIAFRAGHDPYTGMNFESQRQRERYMAENGIIKAVE
jgi:putative FmdB family regulatory protein